MPIFDRVDLACPDIDPTRWPKLSCGAASQLALHDSSLRLEGDRELLFQDGGQIRSFDDTHKLVFNRPSNLLELHERGSIRFLTGEPTPSEKVRIGADGRVGIGTETPEAMLHIAGDLRIDNSVGVMGTATVGGDVRVSGVANVRGNLQVEGNVGIGTISPGQSLDVVGQGLFRSAPWAGAVPGVAGTVIGFDPSNAGGTGFLWSHTTTGAATRLWMDGNPIIFAPNAVERIRVDSDGNVGIGTTSPATKLEVVGDWLGEDGALRLTGDKPTLRFSGGAVSGNQSWILHVGSNGPGNLEFYRRIGGSPSQWGNPVMVLAPTGNVGIRTATPVSQLSLGSSTARTKLALYETDASYAYGLGVVSGQFRLHIAHSGARFAFFDSAAENAREIMTINGNGNLAVTGTARKPGGGMWTNSSDLRLKRNVKPLPDALQRLLKLRGVSYRWQEPEKHGNLMGEQMGLVAQEVEEIFPEWVSTNANGFKDLTIRGLEALVVEAFRDLNNRIEVLELKGEA